MARVLLSALAVALAIVVSGALAGTVTTDPRCAGYTCTLDRNTPAASFTSDPTTCSNSTNCPTCLVGPEWEQRIAELGAFASGRAFQPTVFVNNWLSAEISDTIAAILLRDVLGFQPRLAAVPIDGSMDVICCTEPTFELEKWPSGRFPSDEGYFTVSSLPAGYEGGSGLFIPGYMLDRYPLATSYNAYNVLPEYRSILPRGMSTNCSLLLKDPALGCVDGNYWCDDNTWTNTSCRQGRYVPPQCQADPTQCSEVYLAHPGWDQARFEALIKNTGLPFVAAYLGGSGLPAHVNKLAAERANFMFYWWEPDPLPSSIDARIVNFPPNSYECELKNRAGNGDPTLSGYDCAYPRALMLKLGRRADLAKDVSFKHFFDSFSLTGSDMALMLARHRSAGGNGTAYSVSCDWVKRSFSTWQAWIRPMPTEAPVVQSGVGAATLAPAIAVPIAACIAVALAALVIMRARAQAAVKHAPKKPPLALIFTDVESSTKLWETYGNDMAEAMEIHHDVVRKCIEQHQCYEVKTIGDAFMIACPTVLDATMLCFDIQTQLYEADWPATLVDWKGTNTNADASLSLNTAFSPGESVNNGAGDTPALYEDGVRPPMLVAAGTTKKDSGFRGLNVRMGIHLCIEVEPKFDVTHKRFDYYGHDVNMSARIQGAAQGGQILVTEETLQALQRDPDFEAALGNDCVAVHASRALELKGVAEPVSAYSLLPHDLARRQFEALPGAPDEPGLADSGALGVASCSSAASMSSTFATASSRAVAQGVMLVLGQLEQEQPAVAESAVNALCARYNLGKRGTLPRRTKMLARAITKLADNDNSSTLDSAAVTPSGSVSHAAHRSPGGKYRTNPALGGSGQGGTDALEPSPRNPNSVA